MLNLLVICPDSPGLADVLFNLLGRHVRRVRGSSGLALGHVATDEEEAQEDEEEVEENVEAEVSREALAVAGGVGGLEDLGRCHVTRGPADEGHGQRRRLLSLARHVARYEGEDEVALGQVELGAVEGDEETDAVAGAGWDTVDDGCADDGGTLF